MGMIGIPRKDGIPAVASLFFILLFLATFSSIHWLDLSMATSKDGNLATRSFSDPFNEPNCSIKCLPKDPNPETARNSTVGVESESESESCPHYFRWIHEDLKPWRGSGITRELVEKAGESAHLRVVIVEGKVYVKKYKWVFQTRDVYTVWGILQLLRLYPGEVPDLDLMIECGDKPVIKRSEYEDEPPPPPPPLFHYCGDDTTFDIVFPDWSFWGWPELHIKPWESLREELREGNDKTEWMDREPFAYWKGNTKVAPIRQDLLQCNATRTKDYHARIFELDWRLERSQGFKNADLASQCTHRYKIYVEGAAWSVSEKYILACDSVSLIITPDYYDFFTRSLIPTVHYWPINKNNKCRSIKFAVEWGNSNTEKAQEIGKAGSKFIEEDLKMRHVYEYMFHLLTHYAKLLKYKPTIPDGASEVCPETLLCSDKGYKKRTKLNSMVNTPADTTPCSMPPPFDAPSLQAFLDTKSQFTQHVEDLEADQFP